MTGLFRHYIFGLGAFGSLGYSESNLFAFIQGSETIFLDLGEVYEYIRSILRLDESETFFRIKPFYFSISHAFFVPPKFY